MRILGTGVLLASLLLSGCALDLGEAESALPETEEPAELPRELSGQPEPLLQRDLAPIATEDLGEAIEKVKEREEERETKREREEEASGKEGERERAGGSKGEQDEAPEPPRAESRSLVSVSDPDEPGDGPGYADLAVVNLSQRGSLAIVTVEMRGRVPERLAEGTVAGIGVDLFLQGGAESDYQLFADGSSEGWFAYLHTPDGFIGYPGAFRLGENRIVFELEWKHLGDPPEGSVSAFADWSRKAKPLNEFSEDFAPDEGVRSFRR